MGFQIILSMPRCRFQTIYATSVWLGPWRASLFGWLMIFTMFSTTGNATPVENLPETLENIIYELHQNKRAIESQITSIKVHIQDKVIPANEEPNFRLNYTTIQKLNNGIIGHIISDIENNPKWITKKRYRSDIENLDIQTIIFYDYVNRVYKSYYPNGYPKHTWALPAIVVVGGFLLAVISNLFGISDSIENSELKLELIRQLKEAKWLSYSDIPNEFKHIEQ